MLPFSIYALGSNPVREASDSLPSSESPMVSMYLEDINKINVVEHIIHQNPVKVTFTRPMPNHDLMQR